MMRRSVRVAHPEQEKRRSVKAEPHKEQKEVRENRTRNEFKASGLNELIAIPYSFVGNDIRHLYPRGVGSRTSFPDWYKLTPAYQISNSGMSVGKHVQSFVTPSSGNFVTKRIGRWVKEDKTVIYCDWADKITSICTIGILLMTMIIGIWQLWIGATPKFVHKKGNDATPEEQAAIDKYNEYGTHILWTVAKVVLSALSAAIVVRGVYKRTTIPLADTKIKSFGTTLPLDHLHNSNPPLARRRTMTSHMTDESVFTTLGQKIEKGKDWFADKTKRQARVQPRPTVSPIISANSRKSFTNNKDINDAFSNVGPINIDVNRASVDEMIDNDASYEMGQFTNDNDDSYDSTPVGAFRDYE